ncbi:HTH-type transcriptional regulator GltR [Pandoraea terrae]|uniref:HTH-type transcriptional regulator GltR n=1 Tax=Pandoraea terrae TaxID=1537710 RepID=A0A5E4ZB65_9BURK|nr:LysR family transcriptional regulator [Pandoraea terrae]VVE57852.1 HTH-type transcriptional regulator GltR [Pandoraea terrae]
MSKLNQVTDLDLRLLRSFSEIVDRGGFAAAQATLNISQSVLSEHLKTLEIRLGYVLCKRGPGGFKLMPEGEQVYKAAKQLFSAIDEFKADIGGIGDEMTGELVIVVEDEIITNPACHLPEGLKMFSARVGRRVRLRVETMVGYKAISYVADGSAHLGICVSDAKARDVQEQHVFDEVDELYCSKGHPLFDRPDHEITESDLIAHPYSSRGHLEFKDVSFLSRTFTGSDTGLGAQAQLALILSGRDMGYVPLHVATPFVAQGKLRAVRPDLTRRTMPVRVVSRDTGPRAKLVAMLRSCVIMAHSSDQVFLTTAVSQATLPTR